MRHAVAGMIVFLSGFAVMVLEIIGARYLAKDFGSSFYVWVSQIGVVLAALALGYVLGGLLADRFQRASFLSYWLVPAGAVTALIPEFAPGAIDAIVSRHPADVPIPIWWQKIDPALGSLVIFFVPCLVLAAVPTYMIRLATVRLATVGTMSGVIFGASTVGSIAGVFVSGYFLIDYMKLSEIFQATGAVTIGLGVACRFADRWFIKPPAVPVPDAPD